tara:strand:- start:210 stop:434 length:225 start_codon:yes stop_codon:yes gene_type:complete
MNRLIRFKEGVIGGYEKELIEKILPFISTQFRQRKQYFEYYYEEKFFDITVEELDVLSSYFNITLGEFDLIINL